MQPSRFRLAPLLIVAVLLAACGRDSEAPAQTQDKFDRLADKVGAEIREELATENINLNNGNKNLPDAEITPAGDLVIDGKSIPLDDKQRALTLDYRRQVVDIAEAGARVGLQGAELATKAMKEAAQAVFDGTDQATIEERMKVESEGIRASAAALCDQLPELRAAEQALAAAVPEFAPYADMDEHDINDCHAEAAKP